MRAALTAGVILLVALGLQLAMVVGVLPPNLFLAFFGYVGVFVGMFLVVPLAVRQARNTSKTGDKRSGHEGADGKANPGALGRRWHRSVNR